MHLTKLRVRDFMTSAPTLSRTLQDQFKRVHGTYPGESEVRSWRESLPRLADVLSQAPDGVQDGTIYLEYEMPGSSARADALIVGLGPNQERAGIVVELKQWDARSIKVQGTLLKVGPTQHTHPSDQALGYREFLADLSPAFADHPCVLRSCAYLHNLAEQGAVPLMNSPFDQLTQLSPLFSGDDAVRMGAWIGGIIVERPDTSFLTDLDADTVRVSRALFDHVAMAVREQPAWHLLESQRVAFEEVLDLATRQDGERHLVLVTGGPGTGKSIVAMQLMGELNRRKIATVHVTNSSSFTTVMRSLIAVRGHPTWSSKATDGLFRLSHTWVKRKDAFDVALCDEAHRFRRSTNMYPFLVSNRPQAEEIMEHVRTLVAFVDERQILRKAEEGTIDYFIRSARAAGIRPENIHGPIELCAQFRHAGSAEFLNALDGALYDDRVLGFTHPHFAVRVMSSPEALEDWLQTQLDTGYSARLVAGFCWPWSDPQPDGSLVDDVRIGTWSRPWNRKALQSQRYTAANHPYTLWATRRGAQLAEVGCIYSAQGFEFDYVGLIWGPDLVRRGSAWVAQPRLSFDSEMNTKRGTTPVAVALPLLKNAYRVLATRGMRGCAIACADPETAEYLTRALATPLVASSSTTDSCTMDSVGSVSPTAR